jgi:hypothetical protein
MHVCCLLLQLEKFNKVAGRRLLGYMFEEAPMWQQSQQPVCDRTASDPSWLVQVLNSILFVNNMLPAARHQAQGGSSEVGCAYAGHALGGTHPLHHTGRSLLVGKHAPSGTEESSHEVRRVRQRVDARGVDVYNRQKSVHAVLLMAMLVLVLHWPALLGNQTPWWLPSSAYLCAVQGTHTCPDNRTLLFSEHVIDAAHYLVSKI